MPFVSVKMNAGMLGAGNGSSNRRTCRASSSCIAFVDELHLVDVFLRAITGGQVSLHHLDGHNRARTASGRAARKPDVSRQARHHAVNVALLGERLGSPGAPVASHLPRAIVLARVSPNRYEYSCWITFIRAREISRCSQANEAAAIRAAVSASDDPARCRRSHVLAIQV
jgi:hypothetical protein